MSIQPEYDIDRIIEERKKQRLTQRQLANLAGVSLGTVQAYEQKKGTPKHDSVYKMCNALNMSIYDVTISPQIQVFDSPRDFEEAWTRISGAPHLGSEYGRLAAVTIIMEQLNEEGQQEAVRLLELLKKIPEYKKA